MSNATRLVLFALAIRSDNKTWACFPGVDQLISDTGLNRKTVIKATKHLEELNLIRIERRQRKSNTYKLLRSLIDPHSGTSKRDLEVPVSGTSNESLEVPVSGSDVPLQAVRCPTQTTLTRSNSQSINSHTADKRKTRQIPWREELTDMSWAD